MNRQEVIRIDVQIAVVAAFCGCVACSRYATSSPVQLPPFHRAAFDAAEA